MKKKSAWTTPIMVLISQILTGCGNHSVKMIGLPVTGGFSVFLTDITSKVKAAAAGHEILEAALQVSIMHGVYMAELRRSFSTILWSQV